MVKAARGVMRAGAVLGLTALTGCVTLPAVPPPQVPYVAVPGPAKTEAQFRQDDTVCRTQALQLPSGPGVSPPIQRSQGAGTVPAAGTQAHLSAQAQAGQPIEAQTGEVPYAEPPGVAYFGCMVARNNLVEPLQTTPQPVYAYYQPYPIYVGSYFGYGGYNPWLYGGGFYGFYGGFGGWRGYGYRGFGGGYYGGGFRGGGFPGHGFHGGYGGGGFRGGGGRR